VTSSGVVIKVEKRALFLIEVHRQSRHQNSRWRWDRLLRTAPPVEQTGGDAEAIFGINQASRVQAPAVYYDLTRGCHATPDSNGTGRRKLSSVRCRHNAGPITSFAQSRGVTGHARKEGARCRGFLIGTSVLSRRRAPLYGRLPAFAAYVAAVAASPSARHIRRVPSLRAPQRNFCYPRLGLPVVSPCPVIRTPWS
jgi:hypothetical protein